MLALDYSKYNVLVMFRLEDSNLAPTEAQITKFDSDLFDANNQTLERIMTEEQIELRKDNKSTVLLYSRAGSGNLSQRVRKACQFFKNTRDL